MSTTTAGRSRRRRAVAWLGLLTLVMVTYGRSLDDPFQFDDHHAVVDNPNLRSLASVPRFFTDPGTFSADSTLAMYRPLLLTSFAVNHALSGEHPWSYHLGNVLVHAAVVIALFEWLSAWLGRAGPALLGAALFAAHPVHSEAVYYVSSRSESLAALGVLLALLLHRRSVTAAVPTTAAGAPAAKAVGVGSLGALRAAMAPAAAFAAGLLAKSTAIVFVPIVALHDVLVEPRAWRRCWPAHVVYAALAGAYVVVTRDLVAKATLAAPVRGYAEQAWSQVKGLVYYAHLLSVPRGLSVDHQFQLSSSPADPYAASAGALALSVVTVTAAGWRRFPQALFLVLWFLVALAPASLVPLNVIVNEHRLYLAGAAVAAGLAWLSRGGFALPAARGTVSWYTMLSLVTAPRAAGGTTRVTVSPGRRVAAWGLATAVPLLAVLAFLRGAVWDDAGSLWADAMRKGPDMARPRILRALELARRGHDDAAIPLLVSGLRRDPGFVAGYEALVASQTALGRLDEAVATARRATVAVPADAASWALLAEATRARAQAAPDEAAARAWYERSAQAYVEALARDPEVAAYHDNLGNTYQVMGRPEAALPHHERAVELAPGQAASHLNLGNALWMLGREAEAEAAWRDAVAIDSTYAPAWRSLEALYGQRGDEEGLRQVRARRLEASP